MTLTTTNLQQTAKYVQDALRKRGGAFKFVNMDANVEAAKNLGASVDAIYSVALSAEDVTGSITRLQAGTTAPTKISLELNQWRQSQPVGMSHKEAMEIGSLQPRWFMEQVVEMTEAVITDAEDKILAVASASAGLVFVGDGSGSSATASLANNLDIFASLNENFFNARAPQTDRHIFLPASFAKSIRQNGEYNKVNSLGSPEMLREGKLTRFQGFDLHESAFTPTYDSGNSGSVAIAIQKGGIGVAVRPGNSGPGTTTFVDPISGIPLVLTAEQQTYQTVWTVSLLYGVKVLRGDFINMIINGL